MDNLPDDMILELALKMSMKDLHETCNINSRYNELICNNQPFWRRKFISDYGNRPDYSGDWKELYLNYNNLYEFSGASNNSYQINKITGIKPRVITNNFIIDIDHQVYYFKSSSSPPVALNFKAKSIKSKSMYTIYTDMDDNLYTMDPGLKSTRVGNFKAKSMDVGVYHNPETRELSLHYLFVDLESNVYSYGYNKNGECGFDSPTQIEQPRLVPGIKAKTVSCGVIHSIILATDDKVYVTGSNQVGALGLGDHIISVNRFTELPNIRAKFATCGHLSNAIIDTNNDLYIFGFFGMQIFNNPTILIDGCRLVSMDAFCLAFIDVDDNVYFFGDLIGPSPYISQNVMGIPGIKGQSVDASDMYVSIIGTRIKS